MSDFLSNNSGILWIIGIIVALKMWTGSWGWAVFIWAFVFANMHRG
jgi:hypothetical protein